MPFLREINNKYALQGLQVVSISLDDVGTARGAKWQEVSGELNINWLNLLMEGGFGSGFCKDLSISAIPRYILVDGEGKIINDNAPPPADEQLEELLNALLKK